MIKKQRQIPLKIKKLEALLRRLPSAHPQRKKIEEELAKSLAGFYGEQSLDYHLAFLPDKKYLILHDLRIPENENRYFQIDTLVLCERFFLILEVKNISGTLFFDQSFHQLIRKINDKEDGFPDPVLQVRRQQLQLELWLSKHRFPSMPIVSLIIISNPSTIIKTAPQQGQILQEVIHAAALPSKIKTFDSFYQKEIMNSKELRKLSNLLIKQHAPSNPNFLQQFQIHKTEILTGVHCPACFLLPIARKRGSWFCLHCTISYKDAHIPSLNDYALLLGATITNRELRNFLQLPSVSIATKLLDSLQLRHSGRFKNRTYELPVSGLDSKQRILDSK